MADSQWKHGRLTQVLRRTTRGVLLSVGAVTVAGVVGSTILSRVRANASLTFPLQVPISVCCCSKPQKQSSSCQKTLCWSWISRAATLLRKATLILLQRCAPARPCAICIQRSTQTCLYLQLRSDGKDLQLSKVSHSCWSAAYTFTLHWPDLMACVMQMVNALKCAGTDTRVQGLVGCFGDAQQYVAMAQVQELRSSILGFRYMVGHNATIICDTLST